MRPGGAKIGTHQDLPAVLPRFDLWLLRQVAPGHIELKA